MGLVVETHEVVGSTLSGGYGLRSSTHLCLWGQWLLENQLMWGCSRGLFVLCCDLLCKTYVSKKKNKNI
jgi:hypothetical protein